MDPALLVEVARIAQNRLILIGGMNRSKDHLVVLCVVPSFDERLGIDVTVWRPVDEVGQRTRISAKKFRQRLHRFDVDAKDFEGGKNRDG